MSGELTAPVVPPVHAIALGRPALVEASAGTGKTWTIAGLYVRLLLAGPDERPSAGEPYTPRDILVVTFTNAATAELRERIRARVVDVVDVLDALPHDAGVIEPFHLDALPNEWARDEFVRGLLLGRDAAWRDAARARLQLAARAMDTSAIYTIHGFCERVLTEFSFETGAPLAGELLADESELRLEVLADFWRQHVCGAPAAIARALVEKGVTPAAWRTQLARVIDLPGAVPCGVREDATAGDVLRGIDLGAAWDALTRAHGAARAAWLREEPTGPGGAPERAADEFRRLHANKDLNNSTYRQPTIDRIFAELDQSLASDEPVIGEFSCGQDRIDKYRAGQFATGKNGQAPRHTFFEALGPYVDARGAVNDLVADAVKQYRLAAFLYLRDELPRRKLAREQQAFGDLLARVADALDASRHAATADALARQLRARWRVALIDEFQDTDPLQYRIFDAIYAPTSERPAPLFLVGDPKQAIYGFRGADINAYLAAKASMTSRLTLEVNRRSDEAYLDALNALFSGHAAPFLADGIDYDHVGAVPGRARPLDDDRRPLQFLLLPEHPRHPGQPLSKTFANRCAARATAAEIEALLRGGGDAPVHAGEIAVLVPTHRQGALVREALERRGIPYVQRSDETVFKSDEAAELQRLLGAILAPADERRVRAALVGVTMGRTVRDLLELEADAAARDALVDRLLAWRERWETRGFMPMFRAWMRAEHVAERLLRLPAGERRLTNLLHVAELLHAHAAAEGAGPEALCEYLGAQRAAPDAPDDETLLRLESDARRVRIVTIHGSKGLEYPIVFCPFAWDGTLLPDPKRDRDRVLVVHRDGRRELEFATAATAATRADAWARAERETLEEKLRLLYVALTRAKHRCYVAWGHVLGAETSALAWLLYGADPGDGSCKPTVTPPATRAAVRDRLEDLAVRAAKTGGTSPVGIDDMPDDDAGDAEPGGVVPARPDTSSSSGARRFAGRLERAWSTTSFSQMTRGVHSEAPDHDRAADVPRPVEPAAAAPRSRLTFPRGPGAGNVLHGLFEDCDFADAAAGGAATRRLVLDRLRELEGAWPDGRDGAADWVDVTAEMMAAVLNASLPGAHCSLASLGAGRFQREMPFTYSVGALDPQVLASLIRAHHPARARFADAAAALDRPAMQGYMRGFIDLVFEAGGRYYVLDYKSNWLGGDAADYDQAHMEDAIATAHYYLQYLVYTVALHRHLRFALGASYDPERHLGGVHYVFLRGVDGRGRGVYFDRPPVALIEGLDAHIGRLGAEGGR